MLVVLSEHWFRYINSFKDLDKNLPKLRDSQDFGTWDTESWTEGDDDWSVCFSISITLNFLYDFSPKKYLNNLTFGLTGVSKDHWKAAMIVHYNL